MERELLRSRDVSMMHAASERAWTVPAVQFVSLLTQFPCKDRQRARGGVSSGATVVAIQNSS